LAFYFHILIKWEFIQILNSRIEHTLQQPNSADPTHQTKIWTTFTYYSSLIEQAAICLNITNFIQHSALLTSHPILKQKPTETKQIMKTVHIQSNLFYVPVFIRGINWSCLKPRYLEHIRYIKYNNPHLVYALHIAQDTYEYGPLHDPITLAQHANKGVHLNTMQQF